MTKKLSRMLFFAFAMIVLFLAMPVSVYAKTISINSQEVDLYYISSSDSDLTLPQNYKSSFQLKITGAKSVSYSIESGNSVTISKSGLIKPSSTTYYWYGNVGYSYRLDGQEPDSISVSYNAGDSVIKVVADEKVFQVQVHVYSYDTIYADNIMDDYISKNITASMSDYEKISKIAEFVASYDYSPSHSSATGMIIYGGGDCWASTDTIIKMSEKIGFDAWSRNGNNDPGAFGGHRNAMVKTNDGVYYEVEAGYDEEAPRYYYVEERTSLFSYKYYRRLSDTSVAIEVYQYDGETSPKELVIPKEIDGKTVMSIGERFLVSNDTVTSVVIPETVENISDSAFNSCSALQKINLPSSLSTLGSFVFTNCNKLTTITNASKNFIVSNGAIYNADSSILLYVPSASKFTVKDGVTTIADYSFYYNKNLTSITIPQSVKTLGEGAFANCENLSEVIFSDTELETVDDFAFARCYKLKKLTLPNSVNYIGKNVFLDIEDDIFLYGNPTGTVADFAKNNNILYNHTHSYKSSVIEKATCTTSGVKKYTCDCGDSYTKTVKAKGHNYKTTISKATASKNGSKVTKCTTCKNVKSESTIAKIDSITLSSVSYVYNDKTRKPSVIVRDSNGKKLSKDKDYTISYSSGRKKVGKYSVTVKFKGNYSGTKKLTFKIVPKGTTISKLTGKSKKFTLTLKKQTAQTTGYQIQYSTSPKMKNATTKTYAGTSKTTRTITDLRSAKTYYVRVRTYKIVDGKKYYSSWSDIKKVKTK